MNTDPDEIIVCIAGEADEQYAVNISSETERSAIARGSGISKRSAAAIIEKMRAGKAVIAKTKSGQWAGFSYIETWSNQEFVSNSGLIVNPAFRNQGVAKRIKELIFRLSRELFPAAKVFSITTGAAIMALNSSLGFEPVTFETITREESFWDGCKSCVHHAILEGQHWKNCLCTAMLYDPAREPGKRTVAGNS